MSLTTEYGRMIRKWPAEHSRELHPKLVRPNPTCFFGFNPIFGPNFRVQTGRVDPQDRVQIRVGPSGSKIGLSRIGLALRVKIRVKFWSGWSGSFGRTTPNPNFQPKHICVPHSAQLCNLNLFNLCLH